MKELKKVFCDIAKKGVNHARFNLLWRENNPQNRIS